MFLISNQNKLFKWLQAYFSANKGPGLQSAVRSYLLLWGWWRTIIFWSTLQREFCTKKHFFLHDGESSWWIKISIVRAKSNSNDMGPSPWPPRRLWRMQLACWLPMGSELCNLCPFYSAGEMAVKNKIYSLGERTTLRQSKEKPKEMLCRAIIYLQYRAGLHNR